MTPQRRLLAFKLSILSLTVVAVACSGTALVLHSTNNMFGTPNEFTNCTSMPPNKSPYIASLLLITGAIIASGILFSLCLSVFMIVWVLRSQPNETTAEFSKRVPIYLLAALSLLSVSVAFGYYASLVLNGLGCIVLIQPVSLAQLILLGVSVVLMLVVLILSMTLPKTAIDEPYHENKDSEVELPQRQTTKQPAEVYKISVNDNTMAQYVVPHKINHDETSDELRSGISNGLMRANPNEEVSNRKPMVPASHFPQAQENFTVENQGYVPPPAARTPVTPLVEVPRFDRQKMEMVRQYRNSPISRLNENQQQSPLHNFYNGGQRPSPIVQSPIQTQARLNEHVSPLNEFIPRSPLPPVSSINPSHKPQLPLVSRNFEEEEQHPPSRVLIPGLVRSRKRIFDRTTQKEAYLRRELQSKYGMK